MTEQVCKRCSHKWDYKGKAWWIVCPVCRVSFKNTEAFEKYEATKNKEVKA